MGHQYYSTTIDIYTHVSEFKYQEEVGKFGRAMEAGEPEEANEEDVMVEEETGGMGQILG